MASLAQYRISEHYGRTETKNTGTEIRYIHYRRRHYGTILFFSYQADNGISLHYQPRRNEEKDRRFLTNNDIDANRKRLIANIFNNMRAIWIKERIFAKYYDLHSRIKF
jgi:hypothetical protein